MATSRCLGCGGYIELRAYEVPAGVIARGDRLMHEGCVLVGEPNGRPEHIKPVYLIPRNW